MRLENQTEARRASLKALWLLPVLGLGLYFAAAFRKPALQASDAQKMQAYRCAQGYARQQLGQDYFGRDLRKDPITMHFPPFDRSAVVFLGQGRFRCSSYVDFQRRSRPTVRDEWSGIVSNEHGSWSCEQFQARMFGLPP